MSRSITRMEIFDAEHYTPEQREAIISSYPPHERDARIKGIPSLGSGRVFPIADEQVLCDPFEIPAHYVQINGIDFGWDHPFAATRNAWDRDSDIWYICGAYREREATPPIHCASIKPWGDWIPCAWPHDGYKHDNGSGKELAAQYKDQGLNMLPEHATHEAGGNGVEAGILEMLERMQTGRFKVFRNLENYMGEFRLYHREDGKIIKEREDLISSSRYAIMMRRFAKTKPVEVFYSEEHYGANSWMGA